MSRWGARRIAASRFSVPRSVQIRPLSREPKPSQPPERPNRFRRVLQVLNAPYPSLSRYARYVWMGCGLFLASHIFTGYCASFVDAWGISMLPTFASDGDWVWISKWYRHGRGVGVGDVISFKHPVKEGEHAIKRIIGMEGDFVLMNTPGKSEAMIQVPQGHCWVVGDNLKWSRDSRMFGPLPLALVSGKVIWKINFSHWDFAMIEHGLRPSEEFDDLD